MAKYIYYGYEERKYTNRNGIEVTGYVLFLVEPINTGYKFLLQFNRTRKTTSPYFINSERFDSMGLSKHRIGEAIDNILFDQYGNIGSIQFSE